MKLLRLSLAVLTALVCSGSPLNAAPLPYPKASDLVFSNRIRVRLAEAAPKVQIRGDALRISDRGGIRQALAADSSPKWEFRCQNDRIRAVPVGGGQTLDLVQPVSVRAGTVYFHDRPYREELQIHSVGSFCEVVNSVELEKYLAGLVNSEFNSKWNDEAIGAQIVAARTYALYQMKIARGETERHYDVDATVRDQVYDGQVREDLKSQRLVEKTRGLVLTVGTASQPSPLKAFYHSTCGGMTELPEHVWGNSFAGFVHPVRCPFCGGSPALSWHLDLTSGDVTEAFRRAMISSEDPHPEWARAWPKDWRQAVAGKQLLDVRASGHDVEGRVSEVITSWAYFEPRTGRSALAELAVSGARFREWVGPGRFRSASFQVIGHARGSWQFSGRGNGHGVGMCQWGAKTMGERGYKTAAILKYYYPDAVMRKLW